MFNWLHCAVTAAAGQKPTGCADMGKNYEAATC
jgi:hypothetical protein